MLSFPRSSRVSPLEALVALALTGLLVAAAMPRLVQIRRAPGEDELHRIHTRFSTRLGALHGRWLVEGGSARVVHVDGHEIQLTEDGWPTLDPRFPSQDTALELYALVVGDPLPAVAWSARQIQSPESGRAVFELSTPGGGSFEYDSRTGFLSEPGRLEP